MAWYSYSILPEQLTHIESWVVRVSFLLGVITIVPWAALILLDFAFYLYQMIIWELPWIGGRARGQRPPRAPSFNERLEEPRRVLGFGGTETSSGSGDGDGEGQESTLSDTSRNGSLEKGAGTDEKDKENVTPGSDGLAHPSASGDVKRRSGRT